MIVIPEIDGTDPRVIDIMKGLAAQLEELYNYNEYTFLSNADQKQKQLEERVSFLVESAKEKLSESQLSPTYRAYFWLIIGIAYNVYDIYHDQAASCFHTSLRFDPTIPETYLQHGISSIKAGAWRRSELMLAKARSMLPGDERPLVNSSLLFRLRPQDLYPDSLARAVMMGRSAVQINPNSSQAWFALGMSTLRLAADSNSSNFSRASCALRRAIQIRESQNLPFPDARFNLAMLARLTLDLQTAWTQFHTASIEDPSLKQAVEGYTEIEALLSSITSRLGTNAVSFRESGSKSTKETLGLDELMVGTSEGTLKVRICSLIGQGIPQFYLIENNCDKQRDESENQDPEDKPVAQHPRSIMALHQVSSELTAGTTICITKPVAANLKVETTKNTFQFPIVTSQDELIRCIFIVKGRDRVPVTEQSIFGHKITSQIGGR